MLSCKVYNSIQNEELKQAWLCLQTGSDMTAFQYYDWYAMQEQAFLQNTIKRLTGYVRYYVVLEDGEPVLIAPLHIQKFTLKIKNFGYEKGVYFLGMKGYSDYLNFIYKSCTQEQMGYLLDQIKLDSKQKTIVLTQIPESAVSAKILKKIDAPIISRENCVKLNIPDTKELYYAGFNKKIISNLKQQINRYKNNDFYIETELYEGVVQNREVLDKVQQIHAERFAIKNKGDRSMQLSAVVNIFKKPFDEIQEAIKNNEATWLLIGRYKGKIIAYQFGLKDAGAIRIMQLGFDNTYSRFSPGLMTMLKHVDENFDAFAGKTIDFTRGEERYKYRIGGEEHRIVDYCVSVR